MKYYVGQKAEISKIITEKDVYNFAEICGDFNPIHINKEYAEKSILDRQIVQGALVSSLVSAVLGMQLPGEGTIYLRQESSFLKPVFLNERLTACVEIEELGEKGKARLKTYVINQNNEIVLNGYAAVLLPKATL